MKCVEFRLGGGSCDLRDDRPEYGVARGEIDSPFNLNFEDRLLGLDVSSMNDDIVEGPVGSTLDPITFALA